MGLRQHQLVTWWNSVPGNIDYVRSWTQRCLDENKERPQSLLIHMATIVSVTL